MYVCLCTTSVQKSVEARRGHEIPEMQLETVVSAIWTPSGALYKSSQCYHQPSHPFSLQLLFLLATMYCHCLQEVFPNCSPSLAR